jgi:hypothetical protein
MGRRIDLTTLDAPKRQRLVDLMLQYLTDEVVAAHLDIEHSGEEIFTGHREYIEGMETFLADNGGEEFVPLPKWDPATPIPSEFNVVKDEDPFTRPPLGTLDPRMPLPPEYRLPVLCDYESGAELGDAIDPWHGRVHLRIGGTMALFEVASAAPIFWCWHAFLDDVYWDWQSCFRVPPEEQPTRNEEQEKKRYGYYRKLYLKSIQSKTRRSQKAKH